MGLVPLKSLAGAALGTIISAAEREKAALGAIVPRRALVARYAVAGATSGTISLSP